MEEPKKSSAGAAKAEPSNTDTRKKLGEQAKPAGNRPATAKKPAPKHKEVKSTAPGKRKQSSVTERKPKSKTEKSAERVVAGAESKTAGQKNSGGRPLKIRTVKAMQEAIDKYFERTKTAVVSRDGTVSHVPGPYTVTGLALAIGLATRMSLLRYEGRPEFRNTVQRAKARVEEYAEARLYDHGASAGAKFSLANNFEGWREQATPAGINLMIGSVEEAQRFLTGMAGLLEAVEKNVTPHMEIESAKK